MIYLPSRIRLSCGRRKTPAKKLLNELTNSNIFIVLIQARLVSPIYVFNRSLKNIEPIGDVLLDQCTNGWIVGVFRRPSLCFPF